jgi:hypothetical protein
MKMKDNTFNEFEDEGEEQISDINHPFNPKDIDITVELRSLDSIIKRIQYDEIDMNTHFQRKGDLWSDAVMSRLIESILIRFPLPAFYFDATNDDRWLIVDGLQRLSAIRRFVLNCDGQYVNDHYSDQEVKSNRNKPLKLSGLEYLTDCNGLTYDKLPVHLRRRLNESQITVYLIKPGTPQEVKYSVFYRINTGGLSLNPQEIRHALNQNRMSVHFLDNICEMNRFKEIIKVSDKRMQDRELVLRHLAFALRPYAEYRPPLVRYLNDTMAIINEMENDNEGLELLKENFMKALDACYYVFREDLFSKSISNSLETSRGTFNRGLFEVWTVVFSKLSYRDLDVLQQARIEVIYDFNNLLKDKDFDRAITSSTTGYSQVQLRFQCIEKLVNKYINDY